MNFLVDVGVGRSVESVLRQPGHDVRTVRDLDPRMTDDTILELAVREGRIVVTMDKDFGELVYNSGLAHAGVLLLRIEDATGPEKAAVVSGILERHGGELEGAFCVFQRNRLRIRRR
ncbi:MAG: hypothetical protein A3K19_27495 [Lentisphaerae bacterium RIFOXYB12_FULL_65_16]|nr:MAG: hypothetical protein A3K18_06340 [Lentisphaerae bacterium RIFOXYA12_64_32]OGV86457.1 MAG: hypothetical protein A3K19_27495 [Lentisphaerae bacterium RIFOXYB12_FULL_65_16]